MAISLVLTVTMTITLRTEDSSFVAVKRRNFLSRRHMAMERGKTDSLVSFYGENSTGAGRFARPLISFCTTPYCVKKRIERISGCDEGYWKQGGLEGLHTEDCAYTGALNKYDGPVDYTVPSGRVLRGVVSTHDNHYEDRVWDFEVCNLIEHREETEVIVGK